MSTYNFDLRALRHALALAEHGNFSRAAEAVHLTQPALSRSIQALEGLVGEPLFERRRGAIEPTEIGRLLLAHAQQLDAGARDLDRDLRLARQLELGELRIAVGPWGGSALIGPVIGRLNAAHPRLRVRLLVGPWQELPARARAREVDIVVGDLREIEALEDFELRRLSVHPGRVVSRADHPLRTQARVSLKDLFGYPLIGPRLPVDAVRGLQALARQAGREREASQLLAVECDSSSVLRKVLMESQAWSVMPGFMVDEDLQLGRLGVVPGLDLGFSLRFGAAWLKGRTPAGAVAAFLGLLEAHDRELATESAAPAASRAHAAGRTPPPRRSRAVGRAG
jgi:DNA-binding transcriptional LysR family regulator